MKRDPISFAARDRAIKVGMVIGPFLHPERKSEAIEALYREFMEEMRQSTTGRTVHG